MAHEIRSIIFDIGGVIVKPHDGEYYAYLGRKSGHSEHEVKYFIAQLAPEFELGKTTLKSFEKTVAKGLKIKEDEVLWLKHFKEHMEVNADVTDLIEQLHTDFNVAYLSDNSLSPSCVTQNTSGTNALKCSAYFLSRLSGMSSGK